MTTRGSNLSFLRGGGETGALIRAHDWSNTSIGRPEAWPPALKTAVQLLLSARQPIYIAWGRDLISLYNDAYLPIVGQKHPGLGLPFAELWAEIWDQFRPIVEATMRGEAQHFINLPIALAGRPGRDVGFFTFSYTALHDEDGKAAGFYCAASETTDQVMIEKQLIALTDTLEERVAASTAERDRLWTLSEDMLARADLGGMMTAVSPAWTRVLGWSEADLLARPYVSFMHEEDADVTVAALQAMGETGAPTRFENRILTTAGDYKLIQWTVAPEPDGVNFIAVGRDVTADKHRQAELDAMLNQMHEMRKLETIGQLTGGVAHDFNNLLTPIMGALDMLSRRLHGDERAQRMTAGGLQAAERARTLIQRLLAFARRQHLEAQAVNIETLMGGMSDMISRSLGPQIKLTIHCENGLPAATVDPNQLELAVLNLAVNARDAMPEGGELTIKVSAETIGRHAKLAEGRFIRISVADTGVGMDADTLNRAVEPFFTTKEVGRGTGLGLSSVFGLAQQSSGDLKLESAPGKGTIVTLWLPASSTDAIHAHPDELSASTYRARTETVLLVDDEELVRTANARMLSEAGFIVIEAASGHQALQMVKQGMAFDAVVTDYAMPGMTGAMLAQELRRLDLDCPVLLVTGYVTLSDREAGGLPRLAKPFRQHELTIALGALLDEKTGAVG